MHLNLQRLDISHRLLGLRMLVVLPGAFGEGALAVLLPWSVTTQALGTPWLGLLSALLVLAAIVGSLLASPISRWLGSFRMTVYASVASSTCLIGATGMWFVDYQISAFGLALCAIAADGMSDLGFSARTPVLARLHKLSLVKFSSGNWLWAIAGLALGSLLAGWCLSANVVGTLLVVLSVTSVLVTISLTALFVRDARGSRKRDSTIAAVFSRALWSPQVIALTACMVWLSFVYGPMDNLLIPAQLAFHQREASVFGMLAAAGGFGMACGLVFTQTKYAGWAEGKALTLWLGALAACLQIMLVWWLPADWQLIAGTFVTAAVFAPFLPLVESALLLAVKAPFRTLILTIVGTFASGADMLGTAAAGWAASHFGYSTVLLGCALAMLPLMFYAVLLRKTFRA